MSKLTEIFFGGFVVSAGGVFDVYEKSKMLTFSIDLNLCAPPVAILLSNNTLITRCIVSLSTAIAHILGVSTIPEI